jgi:short-subunit dehydrogenase
LNTTTYALITGASSGIGKAIAIQLAEKGYNLVLVARSEKALNEVAHEIRENYKVEALVFPADLSDGSSPQKIKDFCTDKNLPISVLINNAGYAVFGLFDKTALDVQLDMMEVNNNAMVRLCHTFIPLLREQQKAYIMNIASTAAFQAVPAMSLYAASKAFVITFTRGLQMELAETDIHVCCVIPGPTATNFTDRAKMGQGLKDMAAKFEWPPVKVAKVALRGMFAGAVEVIPGFMNSVSYAFIKMMPKRVAEKIAAGIYMKAVKEESGVRSQG